MEKLLMLNVRFPYPDEQKPTEDNYRDNKRKK